MARYSNGIIRHHLRRCNNPDSTNQERGASFEELTCYIFGTIPGISITQRDEMNIFNNEEIDIALWNEKPRRGLAFLPHIILVECKNWNNPVSSIEVSWFYQKLISRGLDFGILIANNGITGDPAQLTASHNIVAQHLAQKRQLLVLTSLELSNLQTTEQLISIMKEKLCRLAVSGRIN